jgi:hypothetical protein
MVQGQRTDARHQIDFILEKKSFACLWRHTFLLSLAQSLVLPRTLPLTPPPIAHLHEEMTSSLSSSQSSFSVADDGEVVDLVQLKNRFESHLPKYGKIWKSMANAARLKETTIMKKGGDNAVDLAAENSRSKSMSSTMREVSNKENEIPSSTSRRLQQQQQEDGILNAIINKQSVSLRVSSTSSSPSNHDDELCANGCNCANPIIEIIDDDEVDDEIASTFDDVNVDAVLVDTSLDDDDDDDYDDESLRTEKKNQTEVNNLDKLIPSDEDDATDSDDSSSINWVRRKSFKNRVFIVDSDDDEEEDDGACASASNGSPKKDNESFDSDFSIEKDSKPHESSSSIGRLKVDDSDEQEWIELSSDEEDEVSPPLKRVNNVVILSDDEEEDEDEDESVNTGHEDDNHSAFTISDDSNDSDNSSIRDRTIRKHDVKPTTDKLRSTATFRKNRDTITSQTFSEFNKQVFHGALSSVIVTWSKKLNKTAGITRMRGKLGDGNGHTRVAAIELSTKVIDDEERLRSTLLHEMCHAAQWLVDGVHKPPHGAIFKKWASKSMSKIRDVEVTTTHNYQIAYKFAWVSLISNNKSCLTYFVVTLILESLCLNNNRHAPP